MSLREIGCRIQRLKAHRRYYACGMPSGMPWYESRRAPED